MLDAQREALQKSLKGPGLALGERLLAGLGRRLGGDVDGDTGDLEHVSGLGRLGGQRAGERQGCAQRQNQAAPA